MTDGNGTAAAAAALLKVGLLPDHCQEQGEGGVEGLGAQGPGRGQHGGQAEDRWRHCKSSCVCTNMKYVASMVARQKAVGDIVSRICTDMWPISGTRVCLSVLSCTLFHLCVAGQAAGCRRRCEARVLGHAHAPWMMETMPIQHD